MSEPKEVWVLERQETLTATWIAATVYNSGAEAQRAILNLKMYYRTPDEYRVRRYVPEAYVEPSPEDLLRLQQERG